MTEYFGVPEYQTNLTLILFFVVYAVAILVWGPLSDRYGRRPILLIGLAMYTVASALCAFSPNIFLLMFFRVVQAIGAGAATAVATAIVKDVYRGRRRESILAIVQSMTVLSPMVAPMIGALILSWTSWRGTFWAQAVLGIVVVGMSAAFEETITIRTAGRALASLRRLGFVLQNRTFTVLILIFAPLSIAGMAFVSASSYIYQETFGVSGQVFSLFFAIYAVGLAIGPLIYVRLSRSYRRGSILTGCFVAIVISGVLVLLWGEVGPWAFILTVLPSSIAMACSRPPAVHLLLDQHEGDAGSVSALSGSAHMVMGSLGMVIISLELGSKVMMIGTFNVVVGLVCGGAWYFAGRVMVRKVRAAREAAEGAS